MMEHTPKADRLGSVSGEPNTTCSSKTLARSLFVSRER